MKSRIILGAAIIAASGLMLRAQQATDTRGANATSQQVAAFERSLRGALDSAAANLAKRVREVWPEQPPLLRFQTDPIVTGVWMPDDNAVFHVLIPAIEEIDLKIYGLRMVSRPVPGSAPRVSNNLPGRVSATGVVEPDPAKAPVVPLTNPDKEYTEFTRQALYDAVLDGALALPIPEGKHLTVIADELLSQAPNPFVTRSRALILQISGQDLLALRQNRITREEARGRIRESKYPN